MQHYKDKRVAVVASTKEEGDILFHILRSFGIEQIKVMLDPREVLRLEPQETFQLFILRHETQGLTGLSLMQRIRASGHYGMENYLLLVDSVTEAMRPLFEEFDLRYVLPKPFTADRIAGRLEALLRAEADLSNFELTMRSARGAYYSGLLTMARELCLSLFRTHGYQERILTLLGEIALKEKKTNEARKFFTAALKVNPGFLPATHRMAVAHMYDRNFQEAAAMLDELLPRNPLNLQLLADSGQASYETGNYDKARLTMLHLKQLDEKDRMAADVLAKVAMAEGRVLDACRHLRKSHSDAELVQFLNNEGVRLSKEKDLDGAIRMYEQCLGEVHDSEFAHAIYYNLGLAHAKRRESGQAAQYFQMALARKPDFVKAQQALARLEPMGA
ncbi:tetratricopeptide repeat protein [Oligoflexus tunisiensis]|uniref:tetratricopeptide repeat protein n=1 Tax=Oligoflexus tunisiensis TaxID=708132 RepID=UPI00114CB711|nr:tetratricopeptide repeat protein [Oligoflexus tunisiensis]